MIDTNTTEYVELMKERALGKLPIMGCFKRMRDILMSKCGADEGMSYVDVGSATSHYHRYLIDTGLKPSKYYGLEIDSLMFNEATAIWKENGLNTSIWLKKLDFETCRDDELPSADIYFSMNSFMYFKSPHNALSKMMKHAKKSILIRSYFCDATYRIVRAQSSLNHDGCQIPEEDILDNNGNLLSYDYWSIYSFALIEAIIKRCDKDNVWKYEWLENNNYYESIDDEKINGQQKRGATEVSSLGEVSYPFIQPWYYLLLTKGSV